MPRRTSEPSHILLLSADEHQQLSLSEFLDRDFSVLAADCGPKAEELVARHKAAITAIITELKTLKTEGLGLLVEAKQQYPALLCIVIKHVGSLPVSAEVVDRRAIQYLREPFEYGQLQAVLRPERTASGAPVEIALIDVVQLVCLSEARAALSITRETASQVDEGWLYFDDGRLTHARSTELHGEAAFYQLMQWERPRFAMRYGVDAPVRDIEVPWEHIFLDYVRHMTDVRHMTETSNPSTSQTIPPPGDETAKSLEEQLHEKETLMATQGIQEHKTILIIDDDKNTRNLLHKSFERADFHVLTAVNGRDGLEQALANAPDIILSDVVMPEMNGYELCKALKDHPVTRDIPIILLTARGDTDSTLEGFQAGADEYIAKPFQIQEVLARVQRVCRWVSKQQRGDTELSGSLDKTPLFELLRFCEEHRISGSVHLRRAETDGTEQQALMQLQLGEIVAIELGEHTDMTEALDELLEWTDGTFSVTQEELQLPGDDGADTPDAAEPSAGPPPPDHEAAEAGAGTGAGEEAEADMPASSRQEVAHLAGPLKEILDELSDDSDGLDHAVIVDGGGGVISAVTPSADFSEELGGILAQLVQFKERAEHTLALGPLQEVLISSADGILMALPIAGLGVFGVAADKQNQGMLRWNCKEALEKVVDTVDAQKGAS